MPSRGSCVQSHRHTNRIDEAGYIHRDDGKPFKTRYNIHNSSFRLPHKRSTTTLSEHLWTLKDAGVIYMTEWTILDKAKPCSPAAIKCDLCLEEKYYILLEKSRLLNKRTKFLEPAPTEQNIFYKIQMAAAKKVRPASTLVRNRSVAKKI